VFYGSWRCYWRRQRGRAVARLVALLPCPSRPRRTRVGFSGDGGYGSWPRACLVAAYVCGGAQLLARWSRACSRWPGSACPGRVCGACSRRPRHGVATTGRVCSGGCRAPPRPGLALACPVGCGGVVWQGGQGWGARGEEVVRHGRHVAGMAMPCLFSLPP
jgi:hypothetical protein